MGNVHSADLGAVLTAIEAIATDVITGEYIIPGSLQQMLNITASEETVAWGAVPIPSFIDNVVFAYLELRCMLAVDTSSSANDFTGAVMLQAQNRADPGYESGLNISHGSYAVVADGQRSIPPIYGLYDLTDLIVASGNVDVLSTAVAANFADLDLYGTQIFLHILMSKS